MAQGEAETARLSPGRDGKEPRKRQMVEVQGIGVMSSTLRNQIKRFYEAVVFLSSLIEACKNGGQVKAPSDIYDPSESPNSTLQCFMNKLAQVCDNVPRSGRTVTSVAITVHNYDNLLYVFASNSRNLEDTETAKAVVEGILRDVGQAEGSELKDSDSSPLFRRVLHNVLSFHVDRIEHYRQGLLKRISRCISDCENDTSKLTDSLNLKEHLMSIQQLANRKEAKAKLTGSDSDGDSDTTITTSVAVEDSESLVRAANALRRSAAYEMVIERTKAGRMNQSEHWYEFQHFIGRLSSYLGVVRSIIVARRRIPELFDNFNITFLQSSTAIPNPINAMQPEMTLKRRRETRSAKSIIVRMTSRPEQPTYQRYAEELQRCNLDRILFSQTEKADFRPIVHCEVLLLDWLCKEYGEEMRSTPFFRDYRYIGCSKPTCRLCEYYFSTHKSGVQVRPGHRNMYPNWMVPDIALEGSPEAAERFRMVDRVLEKVRSDVFSALRDKAPDRKRFDSNTSSYQPCQSFATASVLSDDLVSNFGRLATTPRRLALHSSGQENAAIGDDGWSVIAEEDAVEGEGGNDDGGALLSAGGSSRR